ncbi:MAG: hypothetical protein OXE99_11525 [Cellvibrionales bacterium]|nr:hypothetical protein [Cellvibrionales bacterium]
MPTGLVAQIAITGYFSFIAVVVGQNIRSEEPKKARAILSGYTKKLSEEATKEAIEIYLGQGLEVKKHIRENPELAKQCINFDLAYRNTFHDPPKTSGDRMHVKRNSLQPF